MADTADENQLGSLPPISRRERWATKRKHLWGKFKERAEKYGPLCLGLLVAVVVLASGVSWGQYEAVSKNVLPTVVNVAAILAGFQGTTHAVLIGFLHSRLFKRLRTSGHYRTLLRYVSRSMYSLFLVVGYAILVQVFVETKIDWTAGRDNWLLSIGRWLASSAPGRLDWAGINTALLFGIFVHALASCLRVIVIVVQILHLPPEQLEPAKQE